MNSSLTSLALLCAAFFVIGFTACSLMVLMLRERIVTRAVQREEDQLYGPVLSRANERRRAATLDPEPASGAAVIRLDAFPSRHRGAR